MLCLVEASGEYDELQLIAADASLTANTAIPIETEDLEKMNHLYICPFCDKTINDFKLYDLHVQAHYDDNSSFENQNDDSETGKGPFINDVTQI